MIFRISKQILIRDMLTTRVFVCMKPSLLQTLGNEKSMIGPVLSQSHTHTHSTHRDKVDGPIMIRRAWMSNSGLISVIPDSERFYTSSTK